MSDQPQFSPAVDAYIASQAAPVQALLTQVRATAHASAPGAQELISYRMPALRWGGRIVLYFAAFKGHVGLYPPVRGDADLMQAVAPFAGDKGNLRLPFDQPLPLDLIARIVAQRVADIGALPGATTRPRRRAP